MSTRPSRIVLPIERQGTTRRSFLRMAGYGVAAATLASCTRAPVTHVIPRTHGAEGAPAGRPYWIATTCGGCAAGCGVLAKCVDGRPVKLEGLEGHPVSAGALCAVGQAQVLSLYDSKRLDAPSVEGAAAGWDAADARVAALLAEAKGRVRLLTGTENGPSTRAWIAAFCERHGAVHVAYDVPSASAIADAHHVTHGVRAVPSYRFDRARVVASFGADFLGTWISPVAHAVRWRTARRADPASPALAKHWQIEARTSMTGLRADRRVRLGPWEIPAALTALREAVAALAGRGTPPSGTSVREWVTELAAELWSAREAALVVCDDGEPAVQAIVNEVNGLLGAYGRTLDLVTASNARLGDDAALRTLLADLASGRVGLLVVAGCNPAYDLAADAGFAAAAARVPVVALTGWADETTALAKVVLPELHALESWGDAEPESGLLCVRQPAIRPLRDGRTLRECLARWCGDARSDADLVREHWRTRVFAASGAGGSADAFVDRAFHDGWIRLPAPSAPRTAVPRPAVAAPSPRAAPAGGALAVILYEKVALRDGRHAHNAWLQELPDPVTKAVWDNYACLSPATAERLGVADGDVVRVEADGVTAELPALVQPGQHDGVVALALGYGRTGTDRFSRLGPEWIEAVATVEPGGRVGVNAAPFLRLGEGGFASSGRVARVVSTGGRRALARTQDHHTLRVPEHLAPRNGAVRDAARTLAFADWAKDPAHAIPSHGTHGAGLWPDDHATAGPRWGLSIDLAACDGCSACVVACQAENNVPCVGRDEVLRHREMQWIRIDRYYEGEGDDVSATQQPMMCQHCGNAPCETVCPVLATVHSEDGLNQQVYNRCVGTRYCANNCPYKVRRFNWFDYPREDRLANTGLNPDVTVRMRGVMEKCSLCVQRIQAGKAAAKRRGVPVADGEIVPACAQTCPARAIVFGDLADPQSEVARRAAEGRAYRVLDELNVRPGVAYLADIRHRKPGAAGEGAHHGG